MLDTCTHLHYYLGRTNMARSIYLVSLNRLQQKLDELKILAAKFSFPQDARKILEWANT